MRGVGPSAPCRLSTSLKMANNTGYFWHKRLTMLMSCRKAPRQLLTVQQLFTAFDEDSMMCLRPGPLLSLVIELQLNRKRLTCAGCQSQQDWNGPVTTRTRQPAGSSHPLWSEGGVQPRPGTTAPVSASKTHSGTLPRAVNLAVLALAAWPLPQSTPAASLTFCYIASCLSLYAQLLYIV